MTEIDYQTALLLQHFYQQEEANNSNVLPPKTHDSALKNQQDTLVDPTWELIDPTPDVYALFVGFNQRFFWNKLLSVCVNWSKRMTSCAGVCTYHGRGGMCTIALSEPLLKLRPRKDLVETLLHEMIHAFLFVTHNNRDRDGHGPEFHKHMYRINKEAGTKITVYHSFHDEVRLYQQHWWRCDGPCQKLKPYFGMVRRAYNRAPGPNDRWWGEHSRSCGGNFIKVKEPEKKPVQSKKMTDKKVPNNTDIRNFFPKTVETKPAKKTINRVQSLDNPVASNSKIGAVVNSNVNNIFGFTNLNGTNSKSTHIKGAVRNASSTIVITNKNKTTSTGDKVLGDSTKPRRFSTSTVVQSNTNDKASDNNYETVRNHWLNKFEIPMKKRSSSQDEAGPSSKVPKLSPDTCLCPVCNEPQSNSELNSHLDWCLENEATEKTCIVCNKSIPKSEYEKHVTQCSEETFKDTDDVFIVETKKCELCEKMVNVNEFDVHAVKCLNKTYDAMEEICDVSKNDGEQVECLACGKKILKASLNAHLEECMSGVFDSKNEPIEGDKENDCGEKNVNSTSYDNKYNCPICMELIVENEMNQHIDVCLNITVAESKTEVV